MKAQLEVDLILHDIEQKLQITINKDTIIYYTDGATDSVVFSIDKKYLIKTVDEITLKNQIEFLKIYNDLNCFQKVVLFNKELRYICFEYIEGTKYNKTTVDAKDAINQIYGIVSKYKKSDYNGYGYLGEDRHNSWSEFLKKEVEYSREVINELDISMERVNKALNNICLKNVDKYLIHGDFGTHNFLVSDGKIYVIDPMPVVGDYLYDFYFAVFSSVNIFSKVDREHILSFGDYDLEYKRNLMDIVFFIRMCRAWVYDKENFEVYRKWLKMNK